jgi:hypothetical protein
MIHGFGALSSPMRDVFAARLAAGRRLGPPRAAETDLAGAAA